ncbi:hypothetical protein [Methylocapsa palsarum]|uniref:Uncharacterized protein n=1 Tax=Methylocapsa palsarum TaxID=1612308 RepID=A0A1I3Z7I4_9HYPH|nr:hypothetical protein [Methylocapsa palsarum]SFK40058.1 hypothetical protein SAMN05444581_107132 [Methylocapsa palsarum]
MRRIALNKIAVRLLPVFSALAFLALFAADSRRASAIEAAATPSFVGGEAVPVAVRFAGPLPLQAKIIVNEAEMTEDRQLGGSHLVPGILLGLGLLLGGGWLYGSRFALMFRKDPLTARVRDELDKLDAARLAVRKLAFGAMSAHSETELFDVRALHDTIAERADALLDRAKADFCLDAVDEDYFISETENIIADCKSLLEKLSELQPDRKAGAWAVVHYGPNAVARAKRSWERAFVSDGELRMTTIAQLNQMKWPLWSALKWMAGATPPR